MERIYNFNAGPSTLPEIVMKQVQESFLNYHDLGYGIIEASHRSGEFSDIIEKAEANIRSLMSIPDDYAVLFLQGGASTQFAMIPMNLATVSGSMDYANTGSWSEKAITEAKLFGEVKIAADGKDNGYTEIPAFDQWSLHTDADYLHITSNNTIYGTQYPSFPKSLNRVPLVADMSSDIMSRDINVADFGLIYAGAQKNIGPSGVTIVIIRKELADRAANSVSSMLKYTTHIKANSLYNTPPTFAIYMIRLITDLMVKNGGIREVENRNNRKADLLYKAIDAGSYYSCPAELASRSKMNVCFRLPSEELENLFISTAAENKMVGLKGHRSVGGCRASIYNAMPLEGVQTLVNFMAEFEKAHG